MKHLDLNVSIRNCAISPDLYIKPIDRHQYLHDKSPHPEHLKNSIPYSQVKFEQNFLIRKGL